MLAPPLSLLEPQPRPVAANFPHTVRGLIVDLDAAQGITLNGADVSAWADQSGAANHVGQATAALQPVFTASNPRFKGAPSVDFHKAAGEYLFGSSLPICTALSGSDKPFTVFLVASRTTKISADEYAWTLGNSGQAGQSYFSGGWRYQSSNSQRVNSDVRDDAGTAATNSTGQNEYSDYGPQVLAWSMSGTLARTFVVSGGGNPHYDAAKDATGSGGDYAAQGAITFNRFAIGAQLRSTAGRPCEMEVARVLVYDRELADSERIAVAVHLWKRYVMRRIAAPTDLPGCIGWWDAAQLAGDLGAGASTLEDLVGSLDFSASGFGAPIIAAHENGAKTLLFRGSGTGDAMDTAAAADGNRLHNGSDFTLGVVYRVEEADAIVQPIVDTNGNSATARGFSLVHDGASGAHSLQVKIGTGAANVLNHDSQDGGSRPGAWHLLLLTRQGTKPASEEHYHITLDGETYVAANQANTPDAGDAAGPITLGSLANAAAGNPAWADGVSIGNRPTTSDWQENSGVARSRLAANGAGDSGHLWHISDSPANALLAQRISDAAGRGKWTLTGATISDLEDIASATVGGVDYLYLADIGDNSNARATFNIFRVVEPTITGSDQSTANFIQIVCEYPAGDLPSHKDAETIFVDPATGDIYIVTKRITPAKLYRLAHAASYTGTQTLEFVGDIWTGPFTDDATGPSTGGYYVGGAINDAGTLLVLKNYQDVFVFPRNPATQTIFQALSQTGIVVEGYVGGERPSSHPNNEPKGEGICFLANDDLITTSEYNATYGSSASAYPTFRYAKLAATPIQVEFQEGTNGYAGTSDTYIWSLSTEQGNAKGTETTFVCDYNSGTDERYGLLKFDLSSIPPQATIIGCDLYLNINTEGQFFELRKMYQPWNESSTYTSLGGLPAFDDVDAASVPDAVHGNYDTIQGTGVFVQIKIPVATVQAWVDGTIANEGWVVYGTTNPDGLQFASSENATASDRPRLVVRYELHAKMQLAEMFLYDRPLGRPGELARLGDYAARKWWTSQVVPAAGNGLANVLSDATSHRGFSGLLYTQDREWLHTFRRGATHGSSAGVACLQRSGEALEFTQERVIFDDSANFDWRGTNFLGQISTGRIFLGMKLSETDSDLLPYTAGVLYSDNGGSTWQGPIFLSQATDAWFQGIGSGALSYDEGVNSIVELADGTLLAHFMAQVNGAVFPHIVQCKSADGGATWTEPVALYYGRQPGLGDFPVDERIQEPVVVRFDDGEMLMAIRADTPNEKIYFVRDVTGTGDAWLPAQPTTSDRVDGWGNPRLARDPNSRDGVFLFHRLNTSPHLAVYRYSADRGKQGTWSAARPVTNLQATTTIAGYGGMVYSYPAIGPGGHLWLAFGLEQSNDADCFVRRWANKLP